MVDWGDWGEGGREGEEGEKEREREGETMAHDEDYDFLFFSFSFHFLTCIYILLMMKYIVHFTLFLLIDAKLAVSLGSVGCRRKRAKKRLHVVVIP